MRISIATQCQMSAGSISQNHPPPTPIIHCKTIRIAHCRTRARAHQVNTDSRHSAMLMFCHNSHDRHCRRNRTRAHTRKRTAACARNIMSIYLKVYWVRANASVCPTCRAAHQPHTHFTDPPVLLQCLWGCARLHGD